MLGLLGMHIVHPKNATLQHLYKTNLPEITSKSVKSGRRSIFVYKICLTAVTKTLNEPLN